MPATVVPEPCPDEPNLYQLPGDVHPTYRPVPALATVVIWVSATLVGVLTTWKRKLSWVLPFVTVQAGGSAGSIPWKKLSFAICKAVVMGLAVSTALQDLIRPPSRISIETLRQKYFLPSRLSKYTTLTIANETLGVHYLECVTVNEESNGAHRVLYCNHGFGASSLSWLPALPVLTSRLNCNVGLSHDAAGFGFTGRPHGLESYTSKSSASIAKQLLLPSLKINAETTVVLMGHSMGCITTLQLALQLDVCVPKRIILCAPALGLRSGKKGKQNGRRYLPKVLVDIPASYLLRRAVGRPGFWRRGLSVAWGNAKLLSDTDCLRFQWPSIGKGWERGLLDFARAQSLTRELSTDEEILRNVMALPNTTIDVIVGGKDRIVSPQRIRKFLAAFPNINIVELDDVGHDAFEEDVELFVNTVDDLLK